MTISRYLSRSSKTFEVQRTGECALVISSRRSCSVQRTSALRPSSPLVQHAKKVSSPPFLVGPRHACAI